MMRKYIITGKILLALRVVFLRKKNWLILLQIPIKYQKNKLQRKIYDKIKLFGLGLAIQILEHVLPCKPSKKQLQNGMTSQVK
jgi:hypothetical protein